MFCPVECTEHFNMESHHFNRKGPGNRNVHVDHSFLEQLIIIDPYTMNTKEELLLKMNKNELQWCVY